MSHRLILLVPFLLVTLPAAAAEELRVTKKVHDYVAEISRTEASRQLSVRAENGDFLSKDDLAPLQVEIGHVREQLETVQGLREELEATRAQVAEFSAFRDELAAARAEIHSLSAAYRKQTAAAAAVPASDGHLRSELVRLRDLLMQPDPAIQEVQEQVSSLLDQVQRNEAAVRELRQKSAPTAMPVSMPSPSVPSGSPTLPSAVTSAVQAPGAYSLTLSFADQSAASAAVDSINRMSLYGTASTQPKGAGIGVDVIVGPYVQERTAHQDAAKIASALSAPIRVLAPNGLVVADIGGR